MKRVLTLILALVICVSLCACKSEEAKNAEALITAIGEVTADSAAAISAARDAYSALTEEDKASVENAAVLATAQAAYADILIGAIGEVSVDSEAAITEAEAYLAALDTDAAAQVTKSADLTAAQEAYAVAVEEARIEAIRQSIIGVWVNEAIGDNNMPDEYKLEGGDLPGYILAETNCNNGPYGIEFTEDGKVVDTYGSEWGNWSLSEDGTTITITPKEGILYEVKPAYASFFEEDGFTKLLMVNMALVKPEEEDAIFAYVRQEDYRAAFEKKYVSVSLDMETVHDYIGEPVFIGTLVDEEGDPADAYVFPSVAYEKGLVYLGSRSTMIIECMWDGAPASFYNSYPMFNFIYTEGVSDLKISDFYGYEHHYVKAEYVAENYINEEGHRVIVLTNGVTIEYIRAGSGFEMAETAVTFWDRVDADYNDYIY